MSPAWGQEEEIKSKPQTWSGQVLPMAPAPEPVPAYQAC